MMTFLQYSRINLRASVVVVIALMVLLAIAGCGNSRKPRGQFELEFDNYTVAEGAGSLTVRITRNSGRAGIVTVNVATQGGTATGGVDYTVVNTTVTFEINDVEPKSITIPILNDTLAEGDEAFGVVLSEPTARARLGSISSALVTIRDNAPVANAGPDQSVAANQTVTLNGSGSTDPDMNPLTYLWTFTSRPNGGNAALSDNTAVMPTFVPDRAGVYVLQLVVNDGQTNSAADSVSISTLPTNVAPVANAGPDQRIFEDETIQLTGAASTDANGNPLTFVWQLTAVPVGSLAQLSDASIVNPTFVADERGNYVAQLIVNDGALNSTPDVITLSTETTTPVANAGADQARTANELVMLDGTASSDPDGDTLSFAWAFLVRPSASNSTLTAADSPTPTFTTDRAGLYVIQLNVSDGNLVAADTVVVDTTGGNTAPTANAGADQTGIARNATVTLTGSASTDPQNNPLTYQWTLTTRPTDSASVLTNPTQAQPTFVPDVAGTYVAQLIVNDGALDSTPDTVSVTVQ